MAEQQFRGGRPYAQDFTGRRIGRLVVIGPAGYHLLPSGKRVRRFLCRCDCGNETTVLNPALYRKEASCGCLRRERSSARSRTHGKSQTPAYYSWRGALKRCYDKDDPAYPHYGAKGVTVCERWHTFENFYADMGERPDGTSLDRIDTFGNYEPENCRWADVFTQARNHRRQRRIVHEGRDLHVEEWEEITGIHHEVIWQRIHGRKWDVARALSEPVDEWYSHPGPQKKRRPKRSK